MTSQNSGSQCSDSFLVCGTSPYLFPESSLLWPALKSKRERQLHALGATQRANTSFSATKRFNSWQQWQYVLKGVSRNFSHICGLGCVLSLISCLNILCCFSALLSVAPWLSPVFFPQQAFPMLYAGYSQTHKDSLLIWYCLWVLTTIKASKFCSY